PLTEVVDYHTNVSGITEGMVQSSSHTLETVKVELNKLISRNMINIGHGVIKSLHQLYHEIIFTTDTSIHKSLMFTHPKRPPYKQPLRFLALSRRIQEGKIGHGSYYDALAAVDVVKTK
ncbi:hypothetical protein BJ742DRAFT_657395, partial [Cladochytrium replicatum]